MRGDAGESVDVRLVFDAAGHHRLQVGGAGILDRHAVAGHHGQHAVNVEDRLIDAVGGEVPEAVEVRLIFEFESPGDGPQQVDAVLGREVEMAGYDCRGIARI